MSTIAFISTMEAVPWGGSEELWSQAAMRLLQQKYRVVANLLWWPEPSQQVCRLQEAGCQVEWRRINPPQGVAGRITQKIIRRIRPPIETWLDVSRPDLVVISQGDPYSGVGWAEQCQQRQIPYALIVQAAGEHWWPDDAYAARAAECYENAVASYFVSNGNLALTRTQLATPITNAKVVWNPFNVSYDAAEVWPEESDILRLACVARLEPFAKGQDILFGVLKAEKWRRRRVEVSLYGVGQNGATLKKLKELYGLDNIHFAGFTSNIEEVWKTHHALVLPSRHEGLPLALVEAMLCGRPAIVTDIAGNTELVEDGVTGFVAAAPTEQHLDEAMERVWTQREELPQMGQEAGASIRRRVPRDPISVFVTELQRLLP